MFEWFPVLLALLESFPEFACCKSHRSIAFEKERKGNRKFNEMDNDLKAKKLFEGKALSIHRSTQETIKAFVSFVVVSLPERK